MTIKQTIKAWKNAENSATNSPVGTAQIDVSILAQVQGGANIVQTGCIPQPPFKSCPFEDILIAF
jgi:hypothetical protein